MQVLNKYLLTGRFLNIFKVKKREHHATVNMNGVKTNFMVAEVFQRASVLSPQEVPRMPGLQSEFPGKEFSGCFLPWVLNNRVKSYSDAHICCPEGKTRVCTVWQVRRMARDLNRCLRRPRMGRTFCSCSWIPTQGHAGWGTWGVRKTRCLGKKSQAILEILYGLDWMLQWS